MAVRFQSSCLKLVSSKQNHAMNPFYTLSMSTNPACFHWLAKITYEHSCYQQQDKCPSIKAAHYPVLNSTEVDLKLQIFMNVASEAFILLFWASTVTPGGAKCFLSSFLLHYLSTLSHQGHSSSSPQHLPPPTTTGPLRWRIIMCCDLPFSPPTLSPHGLCISSLLLPSSLCSTPVTGHIPLPCRNIHPCTSGLWWHPRTYS